jgi:hypothetical protein
LPNPAILFTFSPFPLSFPSFRSLAKCGIIINIYSSRTRNQTTIHNKYYKTKNCCVFFFFSSLLRFEHVATNKETGGRERQGRCGGGDAGDSNEKRKKREEAGGRGRKREGKNACIHIHIQESVESGRSYNKIDNQEER